MFKITELLGIVLIFITFLAANSSNVLLRSRRQSSNGCELPSHPRHGKWTVFNINPAPEPGMLVPSRTLLKIQCNEKYKLIGSNYIPCIDDSWNEPIGQCLKTCPSLNNISSMSVTCTYNNVPQNCQNPLEGTIARFECAHFYEFASYELLHLCRNGNWNNRLPECVLKCGQKVVKKPTLIINGYNTTVNEYPWQAAIYKVNNKELICGGSLINQRMILTAAHCVTEDNGNLRSKELYNIAVGKTYRKMNDARDSSVAQFSAIEHIFIPPFYRGETQNYHGDIAIIITKKTFIISSTVQPVCVDWRKNYLHSLINPSGTVHGYVSGWGYTTENDQPSDVLKYLKVPLVTKAECEKKIPEDYDKYLTPDKLCAGFLNTSASVCKGDSGGGLVFRYDSKFYIIGVVSSSPQVATAVGGCNSQQYSLYTKVPDYISDFILEKESEYRPALTDTNCEDDPDSCTTMANIVTTTQRSTTQTLRSSTSKAPRRDPGEISSRKCKEYSKIEKADLFKNKCTMSGFPLIRSAQPGEFPHTAQLGYTWLSDIIWDCVGTIISENFILTTAHCLDGKYGSVTNVRIDGPNSQSIVVDSLFKHPKYDSNSHYEDIGLIKLKKSIETGRFVRPACLNLNDNIMQKRGIASGWPRFWSSNRINPLKKATFYVMENRFCNNQSSFTQQNLINDALQFCGITDSSDMIKNLAPGSPLQFLQNTPDAPCMYEIVGMLSFGVSNHGVFTKISNYVQWIEEIVWPVN